MRGLRVFLMVLGSIFVLLNLGVPTQGCGYIPPDYFEGYLTFFKSDLSHDSLFARYFFDYFNYQREYQTDQAIQDAQVHANLTEWRQYFGSKIPEGQVSDLIYQLPVETLISALQDAKEGHPYTVSANTALSYLTLPEQWPALEYLIYAKECEPHVIISDPWNYDKEVQTRRNPEDLRQLIETGLRQYPIVKSSFLKVRYAFQIIRLAHYGNFNEDCLKYYDNLVAPLNSKSIVAAWALREKIGALNQVGRYTESTVLSSLMFDQNPVMMDAAFVDFATPIQPTDSNENYWINLWQDCLHMAGNPHRQATLWMMDGLQNTRIQIETLQHMYALEPGSSRLEVMLIRHLNKIERENLSPVFNLASGITEIQGVKDEDSLKYFRELDQFVASVDRQKVRQPALWDAVAGYLSIIEGQHEKARQQLESAANWKSSYSDIQQQIALLQCLNEVTNSPDMTSSLEASCYTVLQGLEGAKASQGWYPYGDQKPNIPKEYKNNLGNIRESFYILLAHKYFNAENNVKGYSCLAKVDVAVESLLAQFNEADFDQVIAFYGQPEKSSFEKLLTTQPKYDVDDLFSFKGTMLLRKRDYQGALTSFTAVSKAHWSEEKKNSNGWDFGNLKTSFEKNYYNPHTGLYDFNHQFMYYSKLDFTRKVVSLLERARLYPEKADRCYYQIANAFFQTRFWSCDENMSGSGYWLEELDDNYYQNPFINLKKISPKNALPDAAKTRIIAFSFYNKALQCTKNQELAAECCFMAQACKTQFSNYEAFEDPDKALDYYFSLLYRKYRQTSYYKHVIEECDTLAHYVERR